VHHCIRGRDRWWGPRVSAAAACDAGAWRQSVQRTCVVWPQRNVTDGGISEAKPATRNARCCPADERLFDGNAVRTAWWTG
jgi:hypothetical protein